MVFQVEIDNNLYEDIVAYCKENDKDVNRFVANLLRRGIASEKYGDTPLPVKKNAANNVIDSMEEVRVVKQEKKQEQKAGETEESEIEKKTKKVRLN